MISTGNYKFPSKILFTSTTLMVYHRKIITFIKKQNASANWSSIKDSTN